MIPSRLPAPMPREEPLRSRANPLYKRLRALKERAGERDLCLLEGPRLVLEALAAGVAVVEAAASARAEASPSGPAALAELRRRGVPVRRMAAGLVASLSETETTQGLLALARRPSFTDEAILGATTPLVLVADGVQNPGNLGGLLRTAEGAAASGAILAGGCADPFSWKALRGSMGSAFRLPHVRRPTVEDALDRLEARGIAVLATAPDGERPYDEADLRGPVALVVGGEGAGLAGAVRERASGCLRIPLAEPVESLNVGVAAALVLFEAARQRGFQAARPGG
jgi:RNA methyltransferase, TrmH family